ncbi:MAG: hypothetical protein ACRDTF_18105 [Pseudonocardiaceae bacterium]
MTEWSPWDWTAPEELVRFVQTGVLPKLVPDGTALPGRSGAPPEIRLRALFDAFAVAGISYDDEPFTSTGGSQEVRTPDQIFVRPGHANCLDLSVAFAGGCLDASLHPIIVVLDPTGPAPAGHVLVVVWVRGDWAGPDRRRHGGEVYPLEHVRLDQAPRWPGSGLRSTWESGGEFVAVDIARVARDWRAGRPTGFEEAVAAAATMLTGSEWRWSVGIDVGLGYRPASAYPMAGWPDVEPLEPPYHPPGVLVGPLANIRARNRVVRFEDRAELDGLLAWCQAPDPPSGLLNHLLVGRRE